MTRPLRTALLPWCLLAAATLGPRLAQADDSSHGVMLPGLVAVPPGSARVAEATVDLQDGQVHEALTLDQIGHADAAAVINGPLFGWRGEADPYPDRQFPELQATLGGVEASPGNGFAAFAGLQDITALVVSAGLDPFTIADTPPIVDRPHGAARSAFEMLQQLGAIRPSDGQFLARWTARRIFRFNLGDRAQTVLTLAYHARPGFDLMVIGDLPHAVRLADYCLTEANLAERLATPRADQLFVVKTFAIPVGIDGKPPERVMAHVENPDALFCGNDGAAVAGGPRTSPRSASVGDGAILHVIEIQPPG